MDGQNNNQGQYNQNQQGPTINVNVSNQPVISNKSRLVAFLLCFFFGYIGVHRFYAGKIGTGILWIFTGGCFGIGFLVDLIMILCGTFRDIYGAYIKNW